MAVGCVPEGNADKPLDSGDTDAAGGSPAEDNDGDGYCEAETCTDGSFPGDCDDGQPAVNPNENDPRDADDIDMNCDGIDGLWNTDYADDDGDGFCEAEISCEGGAEVGDCGDDDVNTFPGAVEIYYNDNNEDCTNTDWNGDYDADGDGSDSDTYGGNDCDDTEASINPNVAEDNATDWNDNCYGGTHNYASVLWTPNADTVFSFKMYDDVGAMLLMIVDSNGYYEYPTLGEDDDLGAVTSEWRAFETEMETMASETLTYVYISIIPNSTTGTGCVVWGADTEDTLALVEEIYGDALDDYGITCAVSDPTDWE